MSFIDNLNRAYPPGGGRPPVDNSQHVAQMIIEEMDRHDLLGAAVDTMTERELARFKTCIAKILRNS